MSASQKKRKQPGKSDRIVGLMADASALDVSPGHLSRVLRCERKSDRLLQSYLGLKQQQKERARKTHSAK